MSLCQSVRDMALGHTKDSFYASRQELFLTWNCNFKAKVLTLSSRLPTLNLPASGGLRIRKDQRRWEQICNSGLSLEMPHIQAENCAVIAFMPPGTCHCNSAAAFSPEHLFQGMTEWLRLTSHTYPLIKAIWFFFLTDCVLPDWEY